jgi:hypothetical protein
MLYAVVTQTFVKTGEFGLYGFPVIAFFYALLRSAAARDPDAEIEHLEDRIDRLEKRLAAYANESGDSLAEPPEEREPAGRGTEAQPALILLAVLLGLLLAGLAFWVLLG